MIMWAWIYLPARLPTPYKRWISAAAAVDPRLITALRRCRWGELRYGLETGQASLLQSMCAEYGWPMVWGDPAQTIPFPCTMVHMHSGPSCAYHSFSRFVRSLKYALVTYLPLNLILLLRRPSTLRTTSRARKTLSNVFLSSLRSASFLATFITLFYSGVCLARTHVGPLILGTSTAARQRLDGGLCVASGCALCGWSILLETAGRRKDIALFVAPRAIATWLPRRYEIRYQWRETLAFALSVAVVFEAVEERPGRVRGILGKVLTRVLEN